MIPRNQKTHVTIGCGTPLSNVQKYGHSSVVLLHGQKSLVYWHCRGSPPQSLLSSWFAGLMKLLRCVADGHMPSVALQLQPQTSALGVGTQVMSQLAVLLIECLIQLILCI